MGNVSQSTESHGSHPEAIEKSTESQTNEPARSDREWGLKALESPKAIKLKPLQVSGTESRRRKCGFQKVTELYLEDEERPHSSNPYPVPTRPCNLPRHRTSDKSLVKYAMVTIWFFSWIGATDRAVNCTKSSM